MRAIGSHTAVELINAGYDVVIIDNLTNSERDSVAGVEKITGKKVAFEVVDTCDAHNSKPYSIPTRSTQSSILPHTRLLANQWLNRSNIIRTTSFHS